MPRGANENEEGYSRRDEARVSFGAWSPVYGVRRIRGYSPAPLVVGPRRVRIFHRCDGIGSALAHVICLIDVEEFWEMTADLYPREVICGGCGVAIMLSWHRSSDKWHMPTPVYQHPEASGCEFDGKNLRPTAISAEVIED